MRGTCQWVQRQGRALPLMSSLSPSWSDGEKSCENFEASPSKMQSLIITFAPLLQFQCDWCIGAKLAHDLSVCDVQSTNGVFFCLIQYRVSLHIVSLLNTNLEIAVVISSFSQCGPSHPSVTLGEAWKVASALRLTRRLQLLKKAIYPAGVRKYMHGLKLITQSSQFLIQVLHQRAEWKKQNVQGRPKRKK